jgi:hypothetical protein
MWGAEYSRGLPTGSIGDAAVIELRPDDRETDRFWAGFDQEARR